MSSCVITPAANGMTRSPPSSSVAKRCRRRARPARRPRRRPRDGRAGGADQVEVGARTQPAPLTSGSLVIVAVQMTSAARRLLRSTTTSPPTPPPRRPGTVRFQTSTRSIDGRTARWAATRCGASPPAPTMSRTWRPAGRGTGAERRVGGGLAVRELRAVEEGQRTTVIGVEQDHQCLHRSADGGVGREHGDELDPDRLVGPPRRKGEQRLVAAVGAEHDPAHHRRGRSVAGLQPVDQIEVRQQPGDVDTVEHRQPAQVRVLAHDRSLADPAASAGPPPTDPPRTEQDAKKV